jgi:hypothetical protein
MQMINQRLLYFLFIFLSACQAENKKAPPFSFDQAILHEDPPEQVVPCGIVSVTTPLLFKASNSDSTIVGFVQCVSAYPPGFFRKGMKYKLEVSRDTMDQSSKAWIEENSYDSKDHPVFLIEHITKAQ